MLAHSKDTCAAFLTVCVLFQGPGLFLARASDGELAEPPVVYESWHTYTTRDGLPHDKILAIHVLDGAVWVGTAGGLALLEGDAWTSWTEHEGLPWPEVSAIDIDTRTGDVWLGTWGGGLIRFSGGRFDQFNQLNSGLAGNLVFAVVAAGDRVWAATNAGLSTLNTVSDTWDLHFERRANAPETAITSLEIDGRYLYAGTWCGPVRRFDLNRGTWSVVTGPASDLTVNQAPSPRPNDTTLGVALAQQSLWWATQDRLLRRDPTGRWGTRRIHGQPAPGRFINCFAALDGSVVALGTDRGLEIMADWSTATWVNYRPADRGAKGRVTLSRHGQILDVRALESAIPDGRIRCIAFHNDDIWVGTASGLARGTQKRRWTGQQTVPPSDALNPDRETVIEPAPGAASAPPPTDAEAKRFQTVNIGILRPGNRIITLSESQSPGVPRLGRMDLMAANLAIEQANAAGGYRGQIPFALATGPKGTFRGWGWTTPEDDFPALAKQPDVWGIVGHLGSGSRFTTAVVLHTEVPLLNFAATPATTDETINPWIFRCDGDDPRQHRLLLDFVFDRLGQTRVAVVRTPGRLAQLHLEWWSDHARERGHPVVIEVRYDPGTDELASVLRALQRSRADVVLTSCEAPLSAAILRGMREAGMGQLFVGSAEIIGDEFAALVGPEPGPVIAPYPRANRANHRTATRFAEDYAARFNRPPSPDALGLFEAVNHLLEAINIAGLDREAIRRTLDKMKNDPSGERHCEQSPYGPDTILMGRLQGGNWELCTFSELGIEGSP